MGVSYCFMMTWGANGFAVLSSSLHTSFYFTALRFITRQPCLRAARQPCQTLIFPIFSQSFIREEIYSIVKYQNNLGILTYTWQKCTVQECSQTQILIVFIRMTVAIKTYSTFLELNFQKGWREVNVAGECYTSWEVCMEVPYACEGIAPGTSDVFSLQLSFTWPFYLCPICSNPQPPEGNRTRRTLTGESLAHDRGVLVFPLYALLLLKIQDMSYVAKLLAHAFIRLY